MHVVCRKISYVVTDRFVASGSPCELFRKVNSIYRLNHHKLQLHIDLLAEVFQPNVIFGHLFKLTATKLRKWNTFDAKNIISWSSADLAQRNLKDKQTCSKISQSKKSQIQSNLKSSNTDGAFTMANSDSFESLRKSSDSSRKQIHLTLVISTSPISNNRLSRSENPVPA